jgi:hypothetical protein
VCPSRIRRDGPTYPLPPCRPSALWRVHDREERTECNPRRRLYPSRRHARCRFAPSATSPPPPLPLAGLGHNRQERHDCCSPTLSLSTSIHYSARPSGKRSARPGVPSPGPSLSLSRPGPPTHLGLASLPHAVLQ